MPGLVRRWQGAIGQVDSRRVSGQRASGARAFEWGVARVSLD